MVESLVTIFRYTLIAIAWTTGMIILINGLHRFIYDLGLIFITLFKRIKYRKRDQLTYDRLKHRDQQNIAIFVAAWDEAKIIDKMIENIINKAEYLNYRIFIGTCPNDKATMEVVDRLVEKNTKVVKVITKDLGPTSKANCLNNIYEDMEIYEKENNIQFEIVLIHDAEDLVHPYEMAVVNYLLPRVDVIQMPIYPAPVSHSEFVYWTYADEFALKHMRDLRVRESLSKFIPLNGVGMAFSRSVLKKMKKKFGNEIFREDTLKQDYTLSKDTIDEGFKIAYVNVILHESNSLKEKIANLFKRLSLNPNFVSNWAYFPMDFKRAIKQKTRWIAGADMQEKRFASNKKGIWLKDALLKDRKVIVNQVFALAIILFAIYGVMAFLGNYGVVNINIRPIILKGSILYWLAIFDIVLATWYVFMRVIMVSRVYGLIAGLLSIIRIPMNSIINTIAAYRAIKIYFKANNIQLKWEKTEHKEGLATVKNSSDIKIEDKIKEKSKETDFIDIFVSLKSDDIDSVLIGLENLKSISEQFNENIKDIVTIIIYELALHKDYRVRAKISSVIFELGLFHELKEVVYKLVTDKDWIVRASTANIILKSQISGNGDEYVNNANVMKDKYAKDLFTKIKDIYRDIA